MKKILGFCLVLLLVISTWMTYAVDTGGMFNLHLTIIEGESIGDQNTFDYGATWEYGVTVAIDFDDLDVGKAFAFYMFNGEIREESVAEFVVTTNTHVVAFYKAADEVIAAFVDTNGALLAVDYLEAEGTPELPGGFLAPTKPGLSFDGWHTELDVITEDIVYTAVYVVDEAFTSVTINGTEYGYNSLVTLTATDPEFTHWEENGQVVSYSESYTFSAIYSKDVVEKTDGGEFTQPLVSISPALSLRETHGSYLARYELPEGFEFVEAGFKYYNSYYRFSDDLELYSQPLKSNAFHPVTNEFLKSFPNGFFDTIVAYLVVNNEGVFETFYSQITFANQHAELEAVSDLIFGNFSNLLASTLHNVEIDGETPYLDTFTYINYLDNQYSVINNVPVENYDEWYDANFYYQHYYYNDYLEGFLGYTFDGFTDNYENNFERLSFYQKKQYIVSIDWEDNQLVVVTNEFGAIETYTYTFDGENIQVLMTSDFRTIEFGLYYDESDIPLMPEMPDLPTHYSVVADLFINNSLHNLYLQFIDVPDFELVMIKLNEAVSFYSIDPNELTWFNEVELTEDNYDFANLAGLYASIFIDVDVDVYDFDTDSFIGSVAVPGNATLQEFYDLLALTLEIDVVKVFYGGSLLEAFTYQNGLLSSYTFAVQVIVDTTDNNDKTVSLFYQGNMQGHLYVDEDTDYLEFIDMLEAFGTGFRLTDFYVDDTLETPLTELAFDAAMASELVTLLIYAENIEYSMNIGITFYSIDGTGLSFDMIETYDGLTLEQIQSILDNLTAFDISIVAVYADWEFMIEIDTFPTTDYGTVYVKTDMRIVHISYDFYQDNIFFFSNMDYSDLLASLASLPTQYAGIYLDEALTVELSEANFEAARISNEDEVIYLYATGLTEIHYVWIGFMDDAYNHMTTQFQLALTQDMTIQDVMDLIELTTGHMAFGIYLDNMLENELFELPDLDVTFNLYARGNIARVINFVDDSGISLHFGNYPLTTLEDFENYVVQFMLDNELTGAWYIEAGAGYNYVLLEGLFNYAKEFFGFIVVVVDQTDNNDKVVYVYFEDMLQLGIHIDEDTNGEELYGFILGTNWEYSSLFVDEDYLVPFDETAFNDLMASEAEFLNLYARGQMLSFGHLTTLNGFEVTIELQSPSGLTLEMLASFLPPIEGVFEDEAMEIPYTNYPIMDGEDVYILLGVYVAFIDYGGEEPLLGFVMPGWTFEDFMGFLESQWIFDAIYLDEGKTIELTDANFDAFVIDVTGAPQMLYMEGYVEEVEITVVLMVNNEPFDQFFGIQIHSQMTLEEIETVIEALISEGEINGFYIDYNLTQPLTGYSDISEAGFVVFVDYVPEDK